MPIRNGVRRRRHGREPGQPRRALERQGLDRQPMPVPGRSIAEGMDAVSCPSAANCTAVGEFITGQDDHQPLAEHWDGTAWTMQPMPVVADTAEFDSVSCPNAGACVAVGNAPVDEGPPLPLAATWVAPAEAASDGSAPKQVRGADGGALHVCALLHRGRGRLRHCRRLPPASATRLPSPGDPVGRPEVDDVVTPAQAGTNLESVACSSWRACTESDRPPPRW